MTGTLVLNLPTLLARLVVSRRGPDGRRRGATAGLAVALLLVLTACAGEFTTQSEPLRLLADGLPDAVLAEPYSEPLGAVGGLRPYAFALEAGTLPPGLVLEAGSLHGTPTAAGSYEFTIGVSDANLASTFEQFTLAVVTPPPPTLSLQPPDTETRGPVTLRARVDDARSLLGLRTLISWDPARFSLVAGSVAATRQNVAMLIEADAGTLQVDLALLTGPLTGGAQLFSFTLEPLETPALVGVATVTEFASRRSGELLFDFQTLSQGPGGFTPSAGGSLAAEPGGAEGATDVTPPGDDVPGEDPTVGDPNAPQGDPADDGDAP